MIGVREILDIPAHAFVGGHHRQRLVMHIAGNAALRHFGDDVASLLIGRVRNANDVQVTGGSKILTVMNKVLHAEFIAHRVVLCDNLLSSGKQAGVSVELTETDCRRDVGHIALVPRADDIIFP